MGKSLKMRGLAAIAVGAVAIIGIMPATPAFTRQRLPVEVGTSCTPTAGFAFCTRYLYDAEQTFTVPANVTSVEARLWGAGGGGPIDAPNGKGGGGGFIAGIMAVTPGQSLMITTGQAGATASGNATSFPNGGPGGTSQNTAGVLLPGGGGGGLTAVWNGPRANGAPLLVAGSGGGAPSRGSGSGGGGGGGLTGLAGAEAAAGRAGTPTQGGAAGTSSPCTTAAAAAGSQFRGGRGGSTNVASQGGSFGGGGGGGAGYFGGGGGGCAPAAADNPGGGGGGSSFVAPTVTLIRTAPGGTGTATPGASGGASDPLYDRGSTFFAPTGTGADTFVRGTSLSAGPGMITLQWNVTVQAVPLVTPKLAASFSAAALLAIFLWRRRRITPPMT